MRLTLNPSSVSDYRTFIAAKSLPQYRVIGRTIEFPDEYADRLGMAAPRAADVAYIPPDFMQEHQAGILRLAITKRKFCVFADCGLGKTLIILDYAKHVASACPSKRVLIVSPLMVIPQTLAECERFYGDSMPVEHINAAGLTEWIESTGGAIGITNYDAIRDTTPRGNLGGLILDESSMLKSHYGKWGTRLIWMGRGLEWKLCCTGTPAPNDRIEYANHGVFMDAYPTVNAFLATYFVNRGQTDNRWELKPHAMRPFYRALSHWAIFVRDPAVYGWAPMPPLPPMHVTIHDVPLTDEQRELCQLEQGTLFPSEPGGIGSRAMMSQLAKGRYRGDDVPTRKWEFIRKLVSSWPDESTIIWCIYNNEQDHLESVFHDAGSIRGDTPPERRTQIIDDFKAGRTKVIISKPKILGFGLNLQVATRQVFSGLMDSYESYYQAVKRSNRFGATHPLNVHIPVTALERPMIDSVLRKADMVDSDTREQEELFREHACA